MVKITTLQKPDHLSSYWKKEWKIVLVVIISGLLFNGSMSVGPILQGKLVDSLIRGDAFETLLEKALLFVGTILLIQFARMNKRYFVRLFANKTSATMRLVLYQNIMKKDTNQLSSETAGDLMNKAVTDVDICVEGMRKVTTEVFDTGVLMSTYFITMLFYSVKITMLACLMIPVAMLIAENLKKLIVKYNKEFRIQSSKISEMTYDNVEHNILYRIHGLEEINQQIYQRELENLKKKSIKANILENSMQSIYNAIAMIGAAAIFYYGGKNVVNGHMSVGDFSAYLAIFTALSIKASKAAKLFNSYQKASVSWKRILPYFQGIIEKRNSLENKKNLLVPNQIIVKNLAFAYPECKEDIIQNINFSIRKGEIIGVTGAVASGKTTLGLALTNLYPYKGNILVDGRELKEFTKQETSQFISYMGHAPQLLSDTIYENITLGVPGDITKVLKDVCFEKDLLEMKEGIYTVVGNHGVRLSGGQQARIALARALYHQASFMILDDPFSAVDMKTEQEIIHNLRTNYQDKMILIISHRLAIFPETNHVLYISKDGSGHFEKHEKLLKENPEYKMLFQLQSGGNLDGK